PVRVFPDQLARWFGIRTTCPGPVDVHKRLFERTSPRNLQRISSHVVCPDMLRRSVHLPDKPERPDTIFLAGEGAEVAGLDVEMRKERHRIPVGQAIDQMAGVHSYWCDDKR